MNRRAVFVFVCLWAAVGLIALLPNRTPEPTRPGALSQSGLWEDPPPNRVAKPDKDDEPAVPAKPDGVDAVIKAAGIGSTLKLSKLALELGLIDKLPDPFDHRKPADAIKAAQAMDQAFPREWFGDDFSYEVSTTDGRLIIHVSKDFLELDEERKEKRFGQLSRIWKMTKFTRDYGFSPTVEFRSKEGWTQTIEK